tara:strand:+ start:450 stop:656 length:207 start_codon:yes stop_codon:yes gene_type:complete
MINIVVISFIVLIGLISEAFAYFDPGTGSFVLQALIGIIATGVATFTLTLNRLKNFFRKLFKKKIKKD